MTGESLKYDGGPYKLGTPIGTLRISARLMTYEGVARPSFAHVLSDIEIAGDMMISPASNGNDGAGPTFCPNTGALLSTGPGS